MNNFNEIERNFFINKGIETTPGQKTVDVKKQYLISLGLQGTYLSELEKNWLRFIILANSSIPASDYISDLLKEALSALGLQTSNSTTENWKTLYLNLN